jgi:hypothetical protein
MMARPAVRSLPDRVAMRSFRAHRGRRATA